MSITEIKRVLIGMPFPNSRDKHERLDKIRALAIFASDPISSNAYATEAIMSVLIIMGSGALSLTMPVGFAVASLVLLVVFSYIQTIMHYPGGGGAYIVAKDNLGKTPSLFAAAALLIDYTLTVSVSISAGVRAVTSAFPEMFSYRILIALVVLLFVTWMNLRGIRESGSVFALPAYAFIVGVLAVIVVGLVRYFGIFGAPAMQITPHTVEAQVTPGIFLFVWLILRAFAGGCTALTGIEAISDGVKAFKEPEPKNAAVTMVTMGIIAMTLFIGITFLGTHLQLIPQDTESILSQLTRRVSGTGFLYFWVQLFTAAILFLAANTGFQDFPRLSYFLAHDNYLPRWMENRGDRLVYSGGITVLAFLAMLLIILFKADEINMLPLYALGVMMSFCLSQSGMFRLMGRIRQLAPDEILKTSVTEVHYERGAWWKRILVGTGAVVTFIVFLVLLITKFLDGAWLVALFIPLLVALFHSIHRHYETVSKTLSTQGLSRQQICGVADVVVVPVGDIHRGTLQALQYAKKLSSDVTSLTIFTSEEAKSRFLERWDRFSDITNGIQLVAVDYDYRDILNPVVAYIKHINDVEFPDQLTTVVVPEFIPKNRLARVLHNQTASRLRSRLQDDKDIVIIQVPFHIDNNGNGHHEQEPDAAPDDREEYEEGDAVVDENDEIDNMQST